LELLKGMVMNMVEVLLLQMVLPYDLHEQVDVVEMMVMLQMDQMRRLEDVQMVPHYHELLDVQVMNDLLLELLMVMDRKCQMDLLWMMLPIQVQHQYHQVAQMDLVLNRLVEMVLVMVGLVVELLQQLMIELNVIVLMVMLMDQMQLLVMDDHLQ
jgi:hypothetical protein